MKRISITILLVAFGIVLAINGAYATAVNFGASQDACMADGSAASVHCGTDSAFRNKIMANVSNASTSVGLVQFNISSIPSGAHVTSAYINLYHYANPAQGASLDLYRVTSAWDESTVTYNTHPAWGPSPVSTTTIYDSLTSVFRMWDVTSVVQGWVSGSYGNYGLLLKKNPDQGMWPAIASKEYDTASGRPLLTVSYTTGAVPEPGSLMVLGSGVAGLLGIIRRRRQ